ncbi:MAG: hypothetical protein RH949_18550 [Coleofasciculus sp. A1-SPW-01]|uniref:hypothetical protein n=1 Tax=Coleofasciculus sp. A1-SPW-01 TaxID=3070819 RepID=UPI0032F8537A
MLYLLSSYILTTRLSAIAWLMAKTTPLGNKRDRAYFALMLDGSGCWVSARQPNLQR